MPTSPVTTCMSVTKDSYKNLKATYTYLQHRPHTFDG